jgi:hypothetical protein
MELCQFLSFDHHKVCIILSHNRIYYHQNNTNTKKVFKASQGWVAKIMKKYNISSQAISSRSSFRSHKNPNDHPQEVSKYKEQYRDHIKAYGDQNAYNFDETSFGNGSGMRTYIQKNQTSQPRVKNELKGKGFSIGCVIIANGQKLDPFINVKGKTKLSLRKYGDYKNNSKCIMTYTESGWYNSETVKTVLEKISDYSKEKPSLLILDSYKAHLTSEVRSTAEALNIKLLFVPKGMTADLQPLDYKFNGPFKNKMKHYWFNNNYNEDPNNIEEHMCKTVIETFNSLKSQLIKNSFACMY